MEKKKGIVIGLAATVLVASLFSSSPKVADPETNQTAQTASFSQLLGMTDSLQEEVLEEGQTTDRVLIIPIHGTIGVDSQTYQQDHILASIDQIKEDPTIKAVLLSIDSPGGGVYATREIYDRLKVIQEERELPIYASMGSMAASGGYYLAMLGDKVYASTETVTGSIGVIMSAYNTQGLMEKLGVKPVVYKSGAMKDILSSSREATEAERQVLQTYIDESYQRFVDVVVDGRNLPEDKVRQLADGRIYSGSQAQALDLVDELGYEQDALAALKTDHGLENAQVFTYQPGNLGFGQFFPGFFGQLTTNPATQLQEAIESIQSLDDMKLEYRLEGGQ